MPSGLTIALMLAQAAAAPSPSYGPAAAAASAPSPAPKDAARDCKTPAVPNPNSREIVVCAERPQGYRLDPDVLTARRMKKKGESVRPRNPQERYVNHDCATVGPMGCRGQPTVDVFTAATALATMAQRLSQGQEIGSMFRTTPTASEYELYIEAKRQREEQEAVKAANAAKTAAQAAANGASSKH